MSGLGGADCPAGTAGAVELLRLHVPDEPVAARRRWYEGVVEGGDLDEVLAGAGGIADWLWHRWQVLEPAGVGQEDFCRLVAAYRRELWLWLAGERTWAQCCSGLLGRLQRRLGP